MNIETLTNQIIDFFTPQPKIIDERELYGEYFGKTDLWVAVNRKYTRVIAIGETLKEAQQEAHDLGYKSFHVTRPVETPKNLILKLA